ncbi:hypothetical protein [Pedobacter jamesrossensis]|uniref:Uncharacterized protein n=1 Tax=Pedobacter jamesrossensis TaxID=1908238 RepID=A0ABV8NE35_9SPHI
MFGLFGKKSKKITIADKIWISEHAKFNACVELIRSNPNVVFVAWFEMTKQSLQTYLQENHFQERVYLADHLNVNQKGKELIFIEHHPLQLEEQKKAVELDLSDITVYSSLSEPFFELFNGEKIINLMRKMGVEEFEMLENSMITNSIKKAQKKIASKVILNIPARSQRDWLINAGINNKSF